MPLRYSGKKAFIAFIRCQATTADLFYVAMYRNYEHAYTYVTVHAEFMTDLACVLIKVRRGKLLNFTAFVRFHEENSAVS